MKRGGSKRTAAQNRAIRAYRSRLGERGLARFEVLGRATDRALIRALARRLAQEGDEAAALRALVERTIQGPAPERGGILAALRRSPLVGADLRVDRSGEHDRAVDL